MCLPTITTGMLGAITRIAKHTMINPILSLESKRSLALADKPSFVETNLSKRGKMAIKVTSCTKPRNERRRFAFKAVSYLVHLEIVLKGYYPIPWQWELHIS